jgi:hypothetical protein
LTFGCYDKHVGFSFRIALHYKEDEVKAFNQRPELSF